MVGSDHYKVFRTLEETAKEKGMLVEGLPAGGIAILNADDPLVLAMASRTESARDDVWRSPGGRCQGVRSLWPLA